MTPMVHTDMVGLRQTARAAEAESSVAIICLLRPEVGTLVMPRLRQVLGINAGLFSSGQVACIQEHVPTMNVEYAAEAQTTRSRSRQPHSPRCRKKKAIRND